MSAKPSLSFNVPEPIKKMFEKLCKEVNGKQKWAVCSAAVLRLAELPVDLRELYVRKVFFADGSDEQYAKLIEDAKAGSVLAKDDEEAARWLAAFAARADAARVLAKLPQPIVDRLRMLLMNGTVGTGMNVSRATASKARG